MSDDKIALGDYLRARSARAGSCVEWTLSRDKDGYGKAFWRGRHSRAHRLAWELSNGPLPAGAVVMHTCDSAPCINQDHLVLGTTADAARLSANDVRRIREMRSAGMLLKDIAAAFGVSLSHVGNVVSGTKWKGVS